MRWMIRLTVGSFAILFIIFTLALPIHVALSKDLKFQDRSIVNNFHYGVNTQGTLQASAAYCWIVGWLFPAWEFYGYDASVHISEETKKASKTVAWAILSGLLLTLFLSVPTLVSLIFCIQDFEAMLKAGFVNNFAEYLRQIVGKEVAFVILIICWFDSMLATTVSFMSAQRVTFALARDRILPCSEWIGKLTPNKMPRNAGIVVLGFAIFIEACILASVVAFTALTATATISTNLSYFFPIVCRLWGKWWKHANKWYLGPISRPIAVIAAIYIAFLFVVLMLPTEFPIKAVSISHCL
jgi:amino acid transporter